MYFKITHFFSEIFRKVCLILDYQIRKYQRPKTRPWGGVRITKCTVEYLVKYKLRKQGSASQEPLELIPAGSHWFRTGIRNKESQICNDWFRNRGTNETRNHPDSPIPAWKGKPMKLNKYYFSWSSVVSSGRFSGYLSLSHNFEKSWFDCHRWSKLD